MEHGLSIGALPRLLGASYTHTHILVFFPTDIGGASQSPRGFAKSVESL